MFRCCTVWLDEQLFTKRVNTYAGPRTAHQLQNSYSFTFHCELSQLLLIVSDVTRGAKAELSKELCESLVVPEIWRFGVIPVAL